MTEPSLRRALELSKALQPPSLGEALDDYARAVGMVVYEWNHLHEELGRLFVVVRRGDKDRLLTKWWSC